jgi:rare lipoprotein A
MSTPRIVSLVPSLTELVCELGRSEWLVGRTGFCIHPHEALARVPKVGGTKTVNVERIRQLAPTHLIVNIDENEKPTVDRLAEFVPNVIVTHPITVEDNIELYQRFGRLFDAQARAGEMCARLESVMANVQTHHFDPLPVLYLIWNDPWMTISRNTFIAQMLARVGIEALVPDVPARYPALALESMAALGPRVMLLSSEPCRFRPADRTQLRAALTAGGLARAPVLGIDGEMTSWYGPRAIDGLSYLLAYRRRLDGRLAMRGAGGSASGAGPRQASALARAGCLVATTLALGLLAACSTTSTSPPPAPPSPSSSDAGASPPAASAQPANRGRFYLDDGPGDRPLAELQKVPDAVPRAEPLSPRANRPYTIFGRQYEPMTRLEPFRERGIATWYGRRYHGRPTSIGEPYDMYAMTAAHPTLPLPSYARVTNIRTGRSIVVRVNDRGPFLHGRVIDLSYAAAAKLAAALPGSAEVEVELITRFDEAPASVASAAAATSAPPVPAALAAPPPVLVAAVPMPNAPSPVVFAPAAPVSATTTSASAMPASTAAPVSATEALSPGRYVQLGAYQSREGAEAALSRLRANGLSEPVMVRRDGLWHKLVAGPFAQAADAQAAQRRLRAATGIEAFVLLR